MQDGRSAVAQAPSARQIAAASPLPQGEKRGVAGDSNGEGGRSEERPPESREVSHAGHLPQTLRVANASNATRFERYSLDDSDPPRLLFGVEVSAAEESGGAELCSFAPFDVSILSPDIASWSVL